MQTGIWMPYLDSTHFSDKFSYKILFISNYGLRDMNLARITHFLQFSEKQNGGFLYRDRGQPERLIAGLKR
jgi:hypothetical protein